MSAPSLLYDMTGRQRLQFSRFSDRKGRFHLSLIDTAVLTFYSIVVFIATAHHEPWADEAQAWQLARNLSLHDLFFKYLHYEGHPGLWFVLLRLLHLAGVSYSGMHWVCAAIGILATLLFLAFSPFPQYLRSLLPFTFFLLFQYVVVARSYVLVPLLLYVIAWQWKSGLIRVFLLLGLLANIQMQVAAIAVGLAIVFAIEQFQTGSLEDSESLRRFTFGAVVFTVLCGVAVATAWPAPDWSFRTLHTDWRSVLHLSSAAASRVLFVGICEYRYLSVPFAIVVLICLKRRRISCLVPFVALGAMTVITKALAPWHAGLINPLLIAVAWVSWPSPEEIQHRASERAASVLWICIAVVQILYAAHAIRYDFRNNYSGDASAAAFLKPYVDRGGLILSLGSTSAPDSPYHAVGILPYFDHPIYANWGEPFWIWSTDNGVESQFNTLLHHHPDLIILESPLDFDSSNQRLQTLIKAGYEPTNRFCGAQPVLFTLSEEDCHLILMPTPGSPTGSAK